MSELIKVDEEMDKHDELKETLNLKNDGIAPLYVSVQSLQNSG
jgi:hypothetical protein